MGVAGPKRAIWTRLLGIKNKLSLMGVDEIRDGVYSLAL